jgi:hypothetical protein
MQYCKSKPFTIVAKTQKVSFNTTCIKHEFGIQFLTGKKNAINLDEKISDNLWKEEID